MALKRLDDGERLGQLVGVRMTPGDIEHVDRVAAELKVSRSEAIRIMARAARVKRVAVIEFAMPHDDAVHAEYAG